MGADQLPPRWAHSGQLPRSLPPSHVPSDASDPVQAAASWDLPLRGLVLREFLE